MKKQNVNVIFYQIWTGNQSYMLHSSFKTKVDVKLLLYFLSFYAQFSLKAMLGFGVVVFSRD